MNNRNLFDTARLTRVVIAVALASMCCGCAPQVRQFDASPRHVCSGDAVTVTWSVSGSATLNATPSVSGMANGEVDDEGKVTIFPKVPTKVDLTVDRFLAHPTTRSQEIEIKTPADPEKIAASLGDNDAAPGCDGGKLWATAHVKRFSETRLVDRVAAHAGDPRSYEVAHGGITAVVAPESPSNAFAGKPMEGDWKFSVKLNPGQPCDDPAIPNNLVVDIYTQCHGGGQ